MAETRKKIDYFPLGNKGWVAYDDVPKVTRRHREIAVGDHTHTFDTGQEAVDAMDGLKEMYMEEQLYRNNGNEDK